MSNMRAYELSRQIRKHFGSLPLFFAPEVFSIYVLQFTCSHNSCASHANIFSSTFTRLNSPSRLDDGFPLSLHSLRHLLRILLHSSLSHTIASPQRRDLLLSSRVLDWHSHGSRKDSHTQRGAGFLRHAVHPGYRCVDGPLGVRARPPTLCDFS